MKPSLRWPGLELALVGLVLGGAALPALLPWARGWPADRFPPHVVIELASDTASVAQLFYDRGDGFSEADSDSVFVHPGPAQPLRFKVRAARVHQFRFDPLTSGGTVRITGLWAEDATGARIVPLTGAAFSPAHQIATLRLEGAATVVVMPAGADDPHLLLSLPAPLTLPRPPPPWAWLGVFAAGAGLLAAGWVRRTTAATSIGAAAAIIGSGAAAWAALWPLHRTLDLPLWDEANYYGWRRVFALTGRLGELAGSPAYHLWYATWDQWLNGDRTLFASHYALKGLAVALAFVLGRRWLASWFGAGFVALGVALSLWLLTLPLLVYLAAFVCFLAALAVADRSRLAAAGFLLLAALTRLEYAFVAVVTLALWAAAARRAPPAPRRASSWLPLVLLPLVLGLLVASRVDGWNPGGRRSWFAFQQHYAVGLAETGRAPGIDPWIDYPTVVSRVFPQAQSLADAVRLNPAAVLGHVGRNLAAAPGQLAQFFVTTHGGRSGAALAALLLAAAFLSARLLPVPGAAAGPAWFAERRPSLLAAFAGLAALPPGLIIYAKTAYLLPAVPAVWALIAWAAARRRTAPGRQAGPVALLLTLAGLAVVLTAPRPLAVLQPQPVRHTLAVLRREFPGPVRLLGVSAESYAAYLAPGSVGLEPLESVQGNSTSGPTTIVRLLAQHRPDAILLTPAWSQTSGFDAAGAANLSREGWRPVPLEEGTLWVRRPVGG